MTRANQQLVTSYEVFDQILRPHEMDELNNEKAITWAHIKSFCDTLTAEELQQPVRFVGESKGGEVFAISKAAGDLFNPSGEGLERVDLYADSEDVSDRETAEEESISFSKGDIFLEVD